MTAFFVGTVGFVLFLLYDINSFVWENKCISFSFPLGLLLILFATLQMIIKAFISGAISGVVDIIFLILAFVALLSLVYFLFFALPFSQTYSNPDNGRPVYSYGVYALCRHPGIICFFAFYLFIGLSALPSPMLGFGLIYSVLNLIYALFQDRITFPRTFCNYDQYKAKVPFLIPNRTSFKRAVRTWGYSYEKEDEL